LENKPGTAWTCSHNAVHQLSDPNTRTSDIKSGTLRFDYTVTKKQRKLPESILSILHVGGYVGRNTQLALMVKAGIHTSGVGRYKTYISKQFEKQKSR
jgi:hypothetical protein